MSEPRWTSAIRGKVAAELTVLFGINQCRIGTCGWLPDGSPAIHKPEYHDGYPDGPPAQVKR